MGDLNKGIWQLKFIFENSQNKNERHEFFLIEIYFGTYISYSEGLIFLGVDPL